MKVQDIITPLIFILFIGSGYGQQKLEQLQRSADAKVVGYDQLSLTPEAKMIFKNAVTEPSTTHAIYNYKAVPLVPAFLEHNLIPEYDREGNIIAVLGSISNAKSRNTHEGRYLQYLDVVKDAYDLSDPSSEIIQVESITDQQNRIHTRLDQVYDGVKVFGGELTVHEAAGEIYMLQGKTKEIPHDFSVRPKIKQSQAHEIAKVAVGIFVPRPEKLEKLSRQHQVSSELIIYHHEGEARLAWQVDIFPSLSDRQSLFVDALDGSILHRYHTLCNLHDHHKHPFRDGKAVGAGSDLSGVTQSVNVYECTNSYFLVDASRPMFRGLETTCDNSDDLLNGVIMTLDAGNTSPANANFDYDISSSTTANNWNNPTAISAHTNGGRAYEYFRSTFGRESITGNGSNIVSFINVSEDDGTAMDNAFWNGEWIFYGNGSEAFNAPLARALDVAGHEMSHGVIQAEANLVYEGEPGALNEHFADVFGILIEREDFRIGEDVVNPSIFRTGTLRDMGNPNNGGTRVGDPGYQPATVDQQFRGREDNGGVHLNSGIPNLAFFTFVTDESFGADINERASIAERIWYKALTMYLRSTSNFSDMRVAIVQAATEDFGATVAAAAGAAFDRVGITAANVTPEIEDFEVNPGQEFVVWSDESLSQINLSTNQGALVRTLTTTSHISRPSTTDNGRFVIFVNQEKQIQAVEIDQNSLEVTREFLVGSEPIWRNAVISRDGTRIAAVTGDLTQGDFENKIIIFDLASETNKEFELVNPTFSEGTTSIAGVLYADVMEFDHTGENLIYDAFNQLSGTFGQDLSYWDIGILNIWNNETSQFEDGKIFKLFSGLPKNVSIGNPTFSKNSPNIIAFDFREIDPITEERTFRLMGLDRETGTVNAIFEGNTFGFPSYSLDDQNIIFNFINNENNIIAITEVGFDKISSTGDAFVLVQDADWGIYLGTGERALTTSITEIEFDELITVYPNPVIDQLSISMDASSGEGSFNLYDLQGRLMHKVDATRNTTIEMSELNEGLYILEYANENERLRKKIVKL